MSIIEPSKAFVLHGNVTNRTVCVIIGENLQLDGAR
jgi:large-conductance mechanosensitive channel